MVAHSFKGAIFGPAKNTYGATYIVYVSFIGVALAIEHAGLGRRLRLRGAVDPQTLRGADAASAVFVLASHHEGYGIAIAEALAHGLPVVITTGGGSHKPWRPAAV